MTVLSGEQFAEYNGKAIVNPYNSKAAQSGGYDLHVGEIGHLVIVQPVPQLTVDDDKRVISDWVNGDWNGSYFEPSELGQFLSEGQYRITFTEHISIPTDCVGFIYPRSSLLRSNCTMTTAVWDSGYNGNGFGYLMVNNPRGIRIERNAAICQLVIHKLDVPTEKQYKGRYQGEGIR